MEPAAVTPAFTDLKLKTHNPEAGGTTSLFLGVRLWGNPQIPNQALATVPGPSNQAAVRRELFSVR